MKTVLESIWRFLVEAWTRIKSGTPSFMKKVQALSGTVAALHLYFAKLPGGAPEWLEWTDSNLTMGIAIAGIIFPQFAVKSSTADLKEKVEDKLTPTDK